MLEPLLIEPSAGGEVTTAQNRVCSTDAQAIAQFLAGYQAGSPHTLRSYAKESTRFVLWLRFIWPGCADALPRVTPATIRDYMTFLESRGTIPPEFLTQSGWPKRAAPFSGQPLKPSSKAHALHVLRSMFDVLSHLEGPQGQAYCRFNPLRGGRGFGLSAMQKSFQPIERGLSFEAWSHVKAAIAKNSSEAERVRDRWIIMLLYLSFLRRSEAISLRMGDFQPLRSGWRLRVTGKGGQQRDIVVVSSLLDELAAYRVARGMPPLPRPDESTPAIGRLHSREPIRTGSLYLCVRRVFDEAAAIAQTQGDEASAETLRVASPHWLRHTGISHAMERGVEPRYVQAQAGHSSLAITGLYDHKDRDAWALGMERWARNA